MNDMEKLYNSGFNELYLLDMFEMAETSLVKDEVYKSILEGIVQDNIVLTYHHIDRILYLIRGMNSTIINHVSSLGEGNVENYSMPEKEVEEILDKMSPHYIDWDSLSWRRYWSKEFMWKYRYKFNWEDVSCNVAISEENIILFENFVVWEDIVVYNKLSDNIIDKYKDKLGIDNLCNYQGISEKFIKENKDEIDFRILATNRLIDVQDEELKTMINLHRI
jgi:hypothetical protein